MATGTIKPSRRATEHELRSIDSPPFVGTRQMSDAAIDTIPTARNAIPNCSGAYREILPMLPETKQWKRFVASHHLISQRYARLRSTGLDQCAVQAPASLAQHRERATRCMRIQPYVAFHWRPAQPLAYAAFGSASFVPRRLRRSHPKCLLPGHRLERWTPPSYDTYPPTLGRTITYAPAQGSEIVAICSALTGLFHPATEGNH